MKRTPLRRKTALKARGKRRFPQGEDKDYQAWIRSMLCWCAGSKLHINGKKTSTYHRCNGVVQATHVVSKGAGGTDRGNLLPLCVEAHRWQHDIGLKSWAGYYGATVDNLKAIARELDARYRLEKEGT